MCDLYVYLLYPKRETPRPPVKDSLSGDNREATIHLKYTPVQLVTTELWSRYTGKGHTYMNERKTKASSEYSNLVVS